MEIDSKKIGYRIRLARKKKEWRQDDLAEEVDKTTTYIGMIERGERLPTLDTFVDIMTALDVTADEILCDTVSYGYQTRLYEYDKKIKELAQKEQQKLYRIMDAYLDD